MPVLQFKGKTAIENYHHTVPHHILEFDRDLSVLDKGEKPGLDGNLIIEGDNLLALKALLPTHAGRIKCIYIDPPYNTGNEGWVFNDNLTQPQFKEWIGQTVGKEGEDATRHDKWCCMMYPRLQLLKELLRDDGAIFISIDDNEVADLRMLMDEIFGEGNFIATIIWRNSTGPKQSKQLSKSHEYILAFAKRASEWKRHLLPRTSEQESDYTNPDNDPRGPWRSGGLDARNYYSKGRYSITCPGGRIIDSPPGGSYWRVSEETLWELDADGRIWWGEDRNNVPRIKRFLSEVQQGLIPQTVWDYSEVGHTQEAKQEYLQILSGSEVFTTPKPVALVKRILQIATSPGDVVLDSFAGTGTTGHAVLEANRDDKGEHGELKFILVQIPYDTKEQERAKFNICQEITSERLRRVVRGFSYTKRQAKGKKKKETVGGLDGSFSYVRTGAPLFGEYRSLGERLPAFHELAKYVFYTETSKEFDGQAVNEATGKIGEYRGTSYYLLYSPNGKGGRALDMEWLTSIGKSDQNKNLVVYCEKLWVHRDDLARYEAGTGHKVRPMIVPFNLK
jgi:adenine-specific DNA-methyltransferase